MQLHVCCIAAFSCYCFTTNVTYRLVQVKWFNTVIRFESEVLPLCSCRIRLWNQFHFLFFYSVKSQLALPLACYSSRGSHAALCVMSGAGPRLPTQRQRVTDRRIDVRNTRKTNKHAIGNYWGRQNYQARFLFIVRLIDLLIIMTGLFWVTSSLTMHACVISSCSTPLLCFVY